MDQLTLFILLLSPILSLYLCYIIVNCFALLRREPWFRAK
ncbi:hypothetical protein PTUN_b0811 [Pseudoalteromonas tunicata]|nr:hypothetical protein PTUN_b0811 [Pseudoalteromonas tunicata]